MKKRIISTAIMTVVLTAGWQQPALAGTGSSSMFSASFFFHLALLAGAVVGLLWAIQIMDLVKGGLMSKSWQMILLGFVSLGLAQVLVLINQANLVSLPEYLATFFYLAMAGTWLAGLHQTRKVLS